MPRQIIVIDQEECIGCGLCANACQEGAIALVDGKATLTRDDYCDGLGNCLPHCPTGAISFETREALPFDREAAHQNLVSLGRAPADRAAQPGGADGGNKGGDKAAAPRNFPVQLQLVAENAPFLQGADLLLSADCAAYAQGDFHRRHMDGRVTLIGCPKLDHHDQAAKLLEIFSRNDISSLTVVRMEVPCCGGLERAARQALKAHGRDIPARVVTLSTQGETLKTEPI